MHTVTIEILRTGTPSNYNLSGDTRYIALCGTHPPVNFSIDCDQYTFNNNIRHLRYDSKETERKLSLRFFEDLITGILEKIKPLQEESNKNGKDDWLHLRLVMTPKELAQLPFELALTPAGFPGEHSQPFLLNEMRRTTLTREIRQVNNNHYEWPAQPRILFAWADPDEDVPHDDHLNALREIIKPLARPIRDNAEPVHDLAPLITPLPQASLRSINNAIKKAIADGNPYTHIHVLAHGIKVTDINGEEFKLALHKNSNNDEPDYANGKELALAIREMSDTSVSLPAVVSLMTCDSSNAGSMILPTGSLAHELHESGIPCVFASQFPLSKPGSVKLVATLYAQLLLQGSDPREALYNTRQALNNNKLHDWASLVAHVRFPEDIDQQLEDRRLRSLLSSMKTTNAWTDHVLKYRKKISPGKLKAVFSDIRARLEYSIHGLLKKCTDDGGSKLSTAALKCEHLGLLGSAYKRQAEHFFCLQNLEPDTAAEMTSLSIAALEKARDFYYRGFQAEPSSHWNAMQYLSLKAVLSGSLSDDSTIWTIIRYMAEKDELMPKYPEDKDWAWGTLAELYLLQPLTVPADQLAATIAVAKEKAKGYISKMAASSPNAVKDSTARQLERYIHWWPVMLPGTYRKELKEMAVEIRKGLPSLEELM